MYISGNSNPATEDTASNSAATPAGSEGQASRQSNLQRIQQRKEQVFNWPHSKKLLKLAIYSACQVSNVKPPTTDFLVLYMKGLLCLYIYFKIVNLA